MILIFMIIFYNLYTFSNFNYFVLQLLFLIHYKYYLSLFLSIMATMFDKILYPFRWKFLKNIEYIDFIYLFVFYIVVFNLYFHGFFIIFYILFLDFLNLSYRCYLFLLCILLINHIYQFTFKNTLAYFQNNSVVLPFSDNFIKSYTCLSHIIFYLSAFRILILVMT